MVWWIVRKTSLIPFSRWRIEVELLRDDLGSNPGLSNAPLHAA